MATGLWKYKILLQYVQSHWFIPSSGPLTGECTTWKRVYKSIIFWGGGGGGGYLKKKSRSKCGGFIKGRKNKISNNFFFR